MKTMIRMLCLFLFVFNLTGCSNSSDQLRDALAEYSTMIDQGIPDDLILTIYYMDPFTSVRLPYSSDLLIQHVIQDGSTTKIIVHSQALKDNLAVLARLNWSTLTPVKEESYMDARIHYVMERGNGEKLLEVTTGSFHGESVFVNGVEVEESPVFYELIYPFLTEDARELLERTSP